MRSRLSFSVIVLCLLAGAIASVVVAMCCQLWMPVGDGESQLPTDQDVEYWKTTAPKGVDGPPAEAFVIRGIGVERTLFLSQSFDAGATGPDNWLITRTGLPVPCLRATIWVDRGGRATRVDGAYYPAHPIWGARASWVPVGVEWSGLAIDTASFGLVALLMWQAARFIRVRP